MERTENAAYYHARNACYLCLEPHNVVDTAVQIEGEGVLAICKGCIAQLAQTAGFDLDDRSEEIEALKVRVIEAEQGRDDAETLLVQSANYAAAIKNRRDEKRAEKESEKNASNQSAGTWSAEDFAAAHNSFTHAAQ